MYRTSLYSATENKPTWQPLHGHKNHTGQSNTPATIVNKHNCDVMSRKSQKACGWKCQSKADKGKVHIKFKGKREMSSTRSDDKVDWMHTLKSFQLNTVTKSSEWEKLEGEVSLQER